MAVKYFDFERSLNTLETFEERIYQKLISIEEYLKEQKNTLNSVLEGLNYERKNTDDLENRISMAENQINEIRDLMDKQEKTLESTAVIANLGIDKDFMLDTLGMSIDEKGNLTLWR